MNLVDSVISEPVEFIFNLLSVVVVKHFFVFSSEAVNFIPNTLYIMITVTSGVNEILVIMWIYISVDICSGLQTMQHMKHLQAICSE